ncbi:MAG: prenyltransferase/squalene oxidase repeat-containing protein [Planctomycetota bacterium]
MGKIVVGDDRCGSQERLYRSGCAAGIRRRGFAGLAVVCATFFLSQLSVAQTPAERGGEVVPRDIREMYQRGLDYLVKTQSADGNWQGGGEQGPGVTGMCMMVLLASGDDPNFGLYSGNIRRALRAIIGAQDANTGYLGPSMYHHGFSMLALAEAYGTVDDRNLWTSDANKDKQRSIGAALELAVRLALTSQKKNGSGAWRYSPDARDADTSVAGSVMVGLLAARNAGIEVPDEAIDKAVRYFQKNTSAKGQVAYSGGLGGFDDSPARVSIATLVFAVARRKDLPEFKATTGFLTDRIDGEPDSHYRDYTRYYQAQALFQANMEAWDKWNKSLVRKLKREQSPDGSFQGDHGVTVSTALNLLAIAVNFRFLPIYER